MININETDINNISGSELQELNEAGTYKGEDVKKRSNRKGFNRRKNGNKPQQDKDLQERKSVAQEIQSRIQKGDSFMSNENKTNTGKRNNIVGGNFDRWTMDVTGLVNGLKQPSLVKCRKAIGIDEQGRRALSRVYQLMSGRVSAFDADSIPTEEEFLRMYNTAGAVVTNYKVNKNWKITIAVKGENEANNEVQTRFVTRNYKDKRDKFPDMDAFGHAINQFGVYKNDDLGICIEPEWVDYTHIGVVEPSDFEIIAQKVQRLNELAGLKNISYGLACDYGCNPDFMTSSDQEVTIDEETFIQYKLFFKNQNVGEMIFASLLRREQPTKQAYSDIDGARAYESISNSRYAELYTYGMDRATLLDVYLRFFMSNLGK